jgi:futalosine hydrolase
MSQVQRLVVVCAVDAEADAVVAGLATPIRVSLSGVPARRCEHDGVTVDVVTAAVGPAAAAAVTAAALAGGDHHGAISMGIAGAFVDAGAGVCDLVVADRIVYADLGVQTDEGFLPIDSLGFGDATHSSEPPPTVVGELAARARAAGITTCIGPVLTLTTFTGTDARALELRDRHGAVAEAMEGAGLATACALTGAVALELRTMSNLVGSRDRNAWDLPGSLLALTAVAQACLTRPLTLPALPGPA